MSFSRCWASSASACTARFSEEPPLALKVAKVGSSCARTREGDRCGRSVNFVNFEVTRTRKDKAQKGCCRTGVSRAALLLSDPAKRAYDGTLPNPCRGESTMRQLLL